MKNRRQAARKNTQHGPIVTIDEERFLVDNISSEGIGVVVEGPDTFFLGQRIEAIRFPKERQDITLNGIVSHISKTDRGYLCGICFVFSGAGDYAFVQALAQEYRDDLQPPALDSNSARKDSPK